MPLEKKHTAPKAIIVIQDQEPPPHTSHFYTSNGGYGSYYWSPSDGDHFIAEWHEEKLSPRFRSLSRALDQLSSYETSTRDLEEKHTELTDVMITTMLSNLLHEDTSSQSIDVCFLHETQIRQQRLNMNRTIKQLLQQQKFPPRCTFTKKFSLPT